MRTVLRDRRDPRIRDELAKPDDRGRVMVTLVEAWGAGTGRN